MKRTQCCSHSDTIHRLAAFTTYPYRTRGRTLVSLFDFRHLEHDSTVIVVCACVEHTKFPLELRFRRFRRIKICEEIVQKMERQIRFHLAVALYIYECIHTTSTAIKVIQIFPKRIFFVDWRWWKNENNNKQIVITERVVFSFFFVLKDFFSRQIWCVFSGAVTVSIGTLLHLCYVFRICQSHCTRRPYK